MCGRYYIEMDDDELRALVERIENGSAVKTGEVFPGDEAAVIAPGGGAAAMRWGFPRWDGKGQIINARSETAADKSMFRAPMQTGRCLVPASWYFEWEKRGSAKIKYALKPESGGIVWLAGISRKNRDTGEDDFVILTRPAWSGIGFIHDRMPVILPAAVHDEWLHGRSPERVLENAVEKVEFREVR